MNLVIRFAGAVQQSALQDLCGVLPEGGARRAVQGLLSLCTQEAGHDQD